MYRVLVAVDLDEARARRQAEYVTDLPHAAEAVTATVLYVFPEESEPVPEEFKQFSRSVHRVSTVTLVESFLEARGVAVELAEGSGNPGETILDEATQREIDAIVLGGRKRSPAGQALFGSVTDHVLRHTDIPVVITGPKHP